MLVANQQQIDLGKCTLGLPSRFKFTVSNKSENVITVENIQVGCGSCTQASTDQSVIPPHGEINIGVVFTPNSRGVQIKRITLYTTGGNLELKFISTVD